MVWLTLILAVFGILFLILMLLTGERDSPISLIFGGLAVVTNLVVAAKVSILQIPYEIVTENTADNSMTIINEEIHEVTTAAPGMYWIFVGFSLVALLWIAAIIFMNIIRRMPI